MERDGWKGEKRADPILMGPSLPWKAPWLRRHDPKETGDLWRGLKAFEEEREAKIPRQMCRQEKKKITFSILQSKAPVLVSNFMCITYKTGRQNVAFIIYFLRQSHCGALASLNSPSSSINLPSS